MKGPKWPLCLPDGSGAEHKSQTKCIETPNKTLGTASEVKFDGRQISAIKFDGKNVVFSAIKFDGIQISAIKFDGRQISAIKFDGKNVLLI